ncbi:hypothetical protein PG996_004929 [Apiospora saccharicola]|uniref:Uncharacterized protein n=1 Tax=Apiospora saccharicola TaxID=335842 RepID=A0ABR1VK23_9PEZI
MTKGASREEQDVQKHGGADELLHGGVGLVLELADLLLGELGRCDCSQKAEVSSKLCTVGVGRMGMKASKISTYILRTL